MIISHEYKFIFIKTRKTAGTSVEKALSALCGSDDILTPDHLHFGEHDELLGHARNWNGAWNPLRELASAHRLIDVARIARDYTSRPKFYNHMRASSVKARLSRAQWNNYYKFCVERNPWEKMVSFYYWNHRGRMATMPKFEDYILDSQRHTTDQHFATDWERYAVGNSIIVDRVCQFENLENELIGALAEAGIPCEAIRDVKIPRLKSDIRPKEPRVKFNWRTRQRIAEVFRREIEAFGYAPPPHLLLSARSNDDPNSS